MASTSDLYNQFASAQTVFNEQMTAEYTPDVFINTTFGLTNYRVIQTTSNGGTVAEDSGTFRLRTGTTANGSARVESVDLGTYVSGSMMLAGLLVMASEAPTGNEDLTWGYYDDNDGFIFGQDATGFYVRLRSGGSTGDKVRQSEWLDPLDGTGGSGLTIDSTTPYIWRIRGALYGQGPAEMYVQVLDSNNVSHYIVIHRFGATSGLLVEKWGLPVRADASNGGDTTSIDLHVGGMQFGTLGRRVFKPRTTCETVFEKSLSGTTIVPIISVRKKTGETKNVRAIGFTPMSASNLQLLIIQGGSLTNASFGSFSNIADAETALEVDTSATAISGGNAIYEDVHAGGTGLGVKASQQIAVAQGVPRDTIVTLAARRESGSGGTLTATFQLEEDW